MTRFISHLGCGALLATLLASTTAVATDGRWIVTDDLSGDGVAATVVVTGSKDMVTAVTVITPSWATLIEAAPDPAVVTDPAMRAAIVASGFAWRVKDTGTNIEMLLIPPGSFTMGCTPSLQYECNIRENPKHAVTLTNAFYLGRYEVTQAQWTAKMGRNPSQFQGASYPDAVSRPVEMVSWDSIASFNAVTGMRLPTEAEWEYAYRAQLGTAVTRTAFHNGTNDGALLGNIAWYGSNSGNQTHAVGGKIANALGLYDMSGNVMEWVNDLYRDTYYSSSPSTNPPGPSSGTVDVFDQHVMTSTGGGPSYGGPYRLLRGGGWYGSPKDSGSSSQYCRGSYRSLNSAAYPYGSAGSGFRAARTP